MPDGIRWHILFLLLDADGEERSGSVGAYDSLRYSRPGEAVAVRWKAGSVLPGV